MPFPRRQNVVGTSQIGCKSYSNQTEPGWWWMEHSRTIWYNMSYRAHLIVPVRNQFSQTGGWGLERDPKVFHITLQKCLCSLSQVMGQCGNTGLKAIKICQAEKMLLDMIACNEATLYVTGYFTFFYNSLKRKILNSPHGNSDRLLQSRSSSPSLTSMPLIAAETDFFVLLSG